MKNKLTNNFGWKLAALFIAIILWFVGNYGNDPDITKQFYDVPVILENVDVVSQAGKIYEVIDNSAVIETVTIKAPQSICQKLTSDDIVATADFNNIGSTNSVDIKVVAKSYFDQISSIKTSSSVVKLNIEDRKAKTLALSTNIIGEVAPGYKIGDITTDQNLVRISGAESVVNSITKAMVEVDVTGFTGDIGTNAEVKLYNAEGKLISHLGLTQNVKSVGVSITVLKTVNMPVSALYQGTPANGYQATGIVVLSKDTVAVAGRGNLMNQMSEIVIPSEAVDITGQKSNYTVTLNVSDYLPQGLELGEGEDGILEVMVQIEGEITKRLELHDSQISIINLPDGWSASFSGVDETFSIQLKGLTSVLSGITAGSVKGTVDTNEIMQKFNLSKMKDDFYSMDVNFNLPNGVELTEPVTILVHITEKQ